MKMDAVPGIPTTMWFTPRYTTAEMRKRTGNPNFTYEISCDQMCGKGHFSMRGVIIVETETEYKKWISEQTPDYFTLFPDKNPLKKPTTDTTTAKVPLAQVVTN
jgi:cytochrome c oxidase subunit 2